MKQLKKTDPYFFQKNSLFFNFLILCLIGLKSQFVVVLLFNAYIFQDLGPLKSIYLTELRATAQIGLNIIARFDICKNLSSAQSSFKSGELNLNLCYYANK